MWLHKVDHNIAKALLCTMTHDLLIFSYKFSSVINISALAYLYQKLWHTTILLQFSTSYFLPPLPCAFSFSYLSLPNNYHIILHLYVYLYSLLKLCLELLLGNHHHLRIVLLTVISTPLFIHTSHY